MRVCKYDNKRFKLAKIESDNEPKNTMKSNEKKVASLVLVFLHHMHFFASRQVLKFYTLRISFEYVTTAHCICIQQKQGINFQVTVLSVGNLRVNCER